MAPWKSQIGRLVVGSALLLIMAGCVPICGIGAKFSLSNARVDSSYTCPNPSSNRPYDVHASIDANNYTNNNVTIKSISETNVTSAIHGSWSGVLGAKGSSDITDFQPKSIGAGNTTTIRFTIAFECSDSGPTQATYGDFTFKFKVVTSSGTYTIDGANTHRLQIQTAP
jgi:hypothetical protein